QFDTVFLYELQPVRPMPVVEQHRARMPIGFPSGSFADGKRVAQFWFRTPHCRDPEMNDHRSLEAGKILVDGGGAQPLDVIHHLFLHPRQAAAMRVGALTRLEDFEARSLSRWASNDDAHKGYRVEG